MISKHTPDGVFLYAPPACRTLRGYAPEERVGRDLARGVVELLLDPQQLVVLGDAIGARRSAGLDLAGTGGDGDDRDTELRLVLDALRSLEAGDFSARLDYGADPLMAEIAQEMAAAFDPQEYPTLRAFTAEHVLRPGYDYLLERKLPALLREAQASPLAEDLARFLSAATELGYTPRVGAGLASQITVRMLIQTGRPLLELTDADFAELDALLLRAGPGDTGLVAGFELVPAIDLHGRRPEAPGYRAPRAHPSGAPHPPRGGPRGAPPPGRRPPAGPPRRGRGEPAGRPDRRSGSAASIPTAMAPGPRPAARRLRRRTAGPPARRRPR